MIGEQITWDSLDDTPKELPLGYLKDDEVERYLGKEIVPFQKLKHYIGKRIIQTASTESRVWYRVILVKRYIENYEGVYAWKDGIAQKTGVCDRLACSDDNRKQQENMWISEIHCSNGRFDGGRYAETMYEILGVDYDADV